MRLIGWNNGSHEAIFFEKKPALKKLLLIALVGLFCPSISRAATPIEDYLAARDHAIAVIRQSDEAKRDSSAFEKTTLDDLQNRMRRIIGPIAVRGFPDQGRLTLTSLSSGYEDFGMLDGLTAHDQQDTIVMVTTVSLLQAWLKNEADALGHGPSALVMNVADALRHEELYRSIVDFDAAATSLAEWKMKPRAGDQLVLPHLLIYTQDWPAPFPPDHLAVSVIRNGRVIIIIQKVKVAPIAACKAVWAQEDSRSNALVKAYDRSGLKDHALFDQSQHVEEVANADYRTCFGKYFLSSKDAPAIFRQAQSLLDRVR